ncbi:MAG: GNAT family N-acetyltransferase [Myxococcales bacterium]|jgi:predicted N-acyltransferase|nr:GNAT family N-acetyltransferase [Myxococcales bacterium]
MKITTLNDLHEVAPDAWNALVGEASPFLEWAWLASLEEAGCVGRGSGWRPQHLALWDDYGRLAGACPLYVKEHSQGEFVFDHGWAQAAARAGIRYYPKLVVASPFTPATGVRFLARSDIDRARVVRVLGTALRDLCADGGYSSVHVNFCVPEEAAVLADLGYLRRTGYQFQWSNPGWRTFDDYLAALRSKRRNQVRREQRELVASDVVLSTYVGEAIPDELFAPMFDLYRSTVEKFAWGHQYLNARLFGLLRRRWKHRLAFVIARRRGRILAGAFNVWKGALLYGRYWGAFEDVRHLHFNVCYYAAIELALALGARRFEPGAGGEFKHLRGFDACPTTSMHFLGDARLADAVRRYLVEERRAVGREIDWLDSRTALRRGDQA